MIAAILTLVGYSMNDTIVVFDRIRENLRLSRREPLPDVVNRSINQTLSRTVLTSGLTFLTVLSLYLFGGEVLHGFSFALVVGILIGTYSSIAVAAPMLVAYQEWRRSRARRRLCRRQSAHESSATMRIMRPALFSVQAKLFETLREQFIGHQVSIAKKSQAQSLPTLRCCSQCGRLRDAGV